MKEERIGALIALHRHWLLADAVRVVLKQKTATAVQEEKSIKKFGLEYVAFGEKASMLCRMQVWYSLLYVVVEGYLALGEKYEPLDEVLAKDEYVSLLRRYRNATFHYQADVLNDKLIEFLVKEDRELWMRDLNTQLEAFLMQALPISEAMGELEARGLPIIPVGTKLSVLFQRGEE